MAKEEAEKVKKERRPQAQKRDIQDTKKRLRNKAFRSSARTVIRNFEEMLKDGDQAAIKAQLSEVYSIMDKGVKKGIFKKNKASRIKERMTARVAAKA